MLSRKGVYPYEYIDSWDKFEETELPSIDHFYSTQTYLREIMSLPRRENSNWRI